VFAASIYIFNYIYI